MGLFVVAVSSSSSTSFPTSCDEWRSYLRAGQVLHSGLSPSLTLQKLGGACLWHRAVSSTGDSLKPWECGS